MGLFLLKIILILAIYLLLMNVFHRGISRWIGLGRRKLFAREIIINEHHEKAERIHNKMMTFALISCFIIDIMFDYEHWYQNPYLYMSFLFFSGSFIKVYMEWKYVEDRREYTYTVWETGLSIVLLISLLAVGMVFLNHSF